MLPGLFESGAYQARVTLRSDYGQAIAEEFDILLPGDDMGVFNLYLKSRIESPPEEERPTHVNLVVKDEAGNPIPDLWLFVTDEPLLFWKTDPSPLLEALPITTGDLQIKTAPLSGGTQMCGIPIPFHLNPHAKYIKG